MGCDSGSDFHGGIVGVGGIVQWVIVGKDGIIVEVMEVVGVEGSRVLFERFRPPHDTVLKRYRVARCWRSPMLRDGGLCVCARASTVSQAYRQPLAPSPK